MSDDNQKPKSAKSGCLIAAVVTLGAVILLAVGGVFLVKRAFSNFDSYREEMCLLNDLAVKDERLKYSPGMDGAMWCRFTVEAKGLDEVFDTSKVDTSEFNRAGYEFRVDWIDDDWWDVDSQQLIGGEVEIGGDYMRVAYVNNEDGTLTVYIFWFEV